jgi:hypothetical protein
MQVGWWQAARCIGLRLRVPMRLWCFHSTSALVHYSAARLPLQALSDTAHAHAEEAQMQWQESISHARALEARQQSYEQVMMALGDSSQQILNRSQQIASSLDVVADYQGRWGGWLGCWLGLPLTRQACRSATVDSCSSTARMPMPCRAEHVLRHLLGQSYSRQDMGFYGLALMAALLVTALPATASARKWLLSLLAASLAAERCAGRLLGRWLGLGVDRRLLLPQLLPVEMQPEGLSIDYIWALRWWAHAALRCQLSHRLQDGAHCRSCCGGSRPLISSAPGCAALSAGCSWRLRRCSCCVLCWTTGGGPLWSMTTGSM